MKTLFLTLIAALFVTAHAPTAFAEEIDDVFLDDGGMIDEPPADAGDAPPVAKEEPSPEPVPLPAVAQDEPSLEEPGELEPVPVPVAKEKKPVKQDKPVKVVKAEPKKAAPKPGKSAKNSRKTASKEGFRTTAAECKMHQAASASSPVLLTVAGAKKLWVEEHNDGWVKAFRKSGHGYLSRDCFD